jgi:large subunit ribosomal protein L21
MSYAIVESGGKQYRVEKGTRLLVDRLSAGEGDAVSLRAVAFADDGEVVLDAGELEKVKIEAKVAEHLRGPKLRVFKYRAKKGYRRRAGHRSELTRLEVTEIKKLSRKPAQKKEPAEKKETAEKKEPAEKKETAEKPTSEKKETAAAKKKPATKKAAPKKQAAKKPAAKKKPASKKSPTTRSTTKKND